MAVDTDTIEHLKQVLRPLGHITARRMFSGAGLYADGVIFALLIGPDGGDLHFKVDADTRAVFEAEGSGPFVYDTRHGPKTVDSYWRSPADPFDDPDACLEFARLALAAARRKAAAEATRPKAKTRTNTKVKIKTKKRGPAR